MSTPQEKNDLKQSLKTAKTIADEGLLQIRYKNPVSAPSETFANVGNWSIWAIDDDDLRRIRFKKELREASQTHPDHLLKPEYIEEKHLVCKFADKRPGVLAYYSGCTGKITLNTYDVNYASELLNNDKLALSSARYIVGLPDATYRTLLHEATHRDHDLLDGALSLCGSPYYTCCVNRLTETTAYAVEYLAAAQQYTFLKKNNIKTLQVLGEDEPIEEILSAYPGLKEYIDKNGFNVNNPKDIKGVVAISSQDWHANLQKSYDKQAVSAVENCGTGQSADYTFSTLLVNTSPERLAQKYDTVSAEMLKDVYVGYNTTVDLTSCRDLLDTMDKRHSAELEPWLDKEKTVPLPSDASTEEILAINAHLEKLGLKTDDEKDEYMQTFLQNIASRKGTVDEELKNILLSYNNKICYNDGLTSVHTPDKTIICGNNITVSIPNTPAKTPTQQKLPPAQLAMLKKSFDR